jgi:hypothetical protein
VEDEWLATVQQAGELRDDLCRNVSNWFVWGVYKRGDSLSGNW